MRAFGKRIKQTASELFSLPPDTLLDIPRLSCLNAEEVVIEHMVALEHVSDTELVVNLGEQTVLIQGRDFVVTLLTSQEIHMKGQVDSITYQRHGRASR
ncbi:hypothetical protein JI721_13825 [Alicyclobacillus cycloheptanicus]|uniref:Sporulation protein YqfC n=1 Tax=Alicyclobacillus cycloheptanicus TaxID=1457 RepID=A0ABT9XJJ6_9BACL|nr:YabP/YqfC family sporulation protein [Alicyclobacillus cycloheptanicus]MDQ0190477.1 sporulation protein YqfC [Alicyclobacillus cycloheptanicus]WDM00760.1 hypothetical protein JI721_13825 [Alicyclobacillus cycloheptanicus]